MALLFSVFAAIKDNCLIVGALFGGLYILWLKRSESKLKGEVKDATAISVQAQASQRQVEEMVEKASDVIARQDSIDPPHHRVAINEWLSEQAKRSPSDGNLKQHSKKSVLNDTPTISKAKPKSGAGTGKNVRNKRKS